MVTVATRIQLAIKEILEEETWKHLKTNNNFDKVLSIASLIEPFDEGPDACYEDYKGMCFGCYDGYLGLWWKQPISTCTIYFTLISTVFRHDI